MVHMRTVRGWCAVVALAGAIGACETARNPGGTQRDVIPPGIKLTTAADTQQIASGLQFTVDASDNLGLKDIRLTYTGGYISQTDTIFNTTVTAFNKGTRITFPTGSGAGGFITVIGRARSCGRMRNHTGSTEASLPGMGMLLVGRRGIVVRPHTDSRGGPRFQRQKAPQEVLGMPVIRAAGGGLRSRPGWRGPR